MGGALLDHLQDAVEHTDHRAEGTVVSFGEAAQAVEMAEELVGAVDEMNDHENLVRREDRRFFIVAGMLTLFSRSNPLPPSMLVEPRGRAQ